MAVIRNLKYSVEKNDGGVFILGWKVCCDLLAMSALGPRVEERWHVCGPGLTGCGMAEKDGSNLVQGCFYSDF